LLQKKSTTSGNIIGFHKFITEKLSVVDDIATIHSVFVMKSAKDSGT
tara:strand:+ start:464 stop:604 length:141 start_codon:yes stop_codon:yes gene_type:complete